MFIDKKKMILAVAAALAIASIVTVIFALMQRETGQSASQSEVRVAITEQGFSPATISIEPGTTVVWVNSTAAPHKIGANPYPDGTALPALKSEAVAPGESYSFTFEKSGTFSYADYTKPTLSGTVQVK